MSICDIENLIAGRRQWRCTHIHLLAADVDLFDIYRTVQEVLRMPELSGVGAMSTLQSRAIEELEKNVMMMARVLVS